MSLAVVELFKIMVEHNGTDLLISAGQPPQIRLDGKLTVLDRLPLNAEMSKDLCFQVMSDRQRKEFERNLEVDFSFGIPGLSRFRANVYLQRGSVSGAFRRIPFTIPTCEELGLPQVAADLCDRPNGLVLVTGPTGCGKSTTLAALIERINITRHKHIITIEDPIEYLYHHKKCTIDQREVGADTRSFHTALRSILRQDPDVVLLGEMRDTESIQAALTIAETGHLCFATLHTNSCSQTLSRIVDVFPGEKQRQIRVQLSMCLNGVITQVLLPRLGGGLQLILEVMIPTPAIKAMVRENKIHNIDNHIQLGSKYGMQTLNQSLAAAVNSGYIDEEDALAASLDKEDLMKYLM
ncbi:MAG: type IV pilus twitching motility protein PilT [Chitinispirillaceae bacterium]|nr:type IV pilus twitching motility protein PilT [Chitinispirillaceae bacterium]